MIKENEDEVLLDVSLEELRGSDTEINDTGVCACVCMQYKTDVIVLLVLIILVGLNSCVWFQVAQMLIVRS